MARTGHSGEPVSGREGQRTHYQQRGKSFSRSSTRDTSNLGRTEASMAARTRISNTNAAWKAMRELIGDTLKISADKTALSTFLSYNSREARVHLTREQAAAGCCVADRFTVSVGGLSGIHAEECGDYFLSDIELGSFQLTEDSTFAQFSAAVLNHNPSFQKGDTIIFLRLLQRGDEQLPHVEMESNDVTLLPDDAQVMGTGDGFLSIDGRLACKRDDCSLVSWIHIRPKGATKVEASTQRLAGTNRLLPHFVGEEAQRRAAESYGFVAAKAQAKAQANETTCHQDVTKEYDIEMTDRQLFILSLLSREPTLSVTKLSQRLKVSERTIKRDLSDLQSRALLRHTGSRQAGQWEVMY